MNRLDQNHAVVSKRPPSGFFGKLPLLIAVVLLAAYYVMAVSASRTKSPTFDEVVHITAGYSAWINHDQRFDPGNGDFVKRWAALPLLRSKPNFPPLSGENWRGGEFFLMGRDFMFRAGNDPDAILLQSRRMVTLIGVALGILVFVCSRSLFGDVGGLISLTAFAFCPHMLAHGALVSSDLTLTFALLASTWLAWRLLHRVSWPILTGSVLAFSLLVISKMSAVLIAPIAVILVVARFFNREPWRWHLGKPRTIATRAGQSLALAALLLIHSVAGWLAIWAVFDFKYVARADPADTQLVLLRSSGAEVRGVIGCLSEFCHQHHVLPEGFLKGMEELVGISQRRPSFMNGHWKAGGRPSFFPYAFWVKTPPALFGLLTLGLAGCAFRRKRGNADPANSPRVAPPSTARSLLYGAIPLFALLVVYTAVALRQGVNIGHRHILPVYPAFYILAGSAGLLLQSRSYLAGVAVALFISWYAIDSVAVRPHYLAYFSPVAGGPEQGYRRLVDSSLDWGQDLPGLKQWLGRHRVDAPDQLFFSYFGTGIPEHYGIESKRLPGFPEWRDLKVFPYAPGYYALSATMFQNVYAKTFGPWNRVYEEAYQKALQQLGLTEQNATDREAFVAALLRHPDPYWQSHYDDLEKLRFGRLCGWLRATRREPDDQIGHSILIWKLKAADLHEALWEAPPELYDFPAAELPDGI